MKAIKVLIFILAVDSVVSQLLDNVIEVNTTSGLVRGQSLNILNKTINQFLNIPYAEPPIGELRFAKPKPLQKSRDGIIDGTKPGNSCIQIVGPNKTQFNDPNMKISEDCLVLNIWAPKDVSHPKPVMFWIYGGGFSFGSIFLDTFSGSVLSTYDVVFVSANYRLGPFGFLYGGEESAPGNVGLFDQLLALKWVRENIHLFGGDKNQITIFGESAGSCSVSAHILSPKSKGLFKRAIMQSGSVLWNKDIPPVSKEEALNNAKQIAKSFNCPDDDQWLKCLKRADFNSFVHLMNTITFPIFGTEFLPFSAKTSLESNNFNRDLDILSGITNDEGATSLIISNREDFKNFVNKTNDLFHNINIEKTTDFYLRNISDSDSTAITQKYFDFLGDIALKCPTYLFVKRYAQRTKLNTNFYFYEMTYALQYGNLVPHAGDIAVIFGNALLDGNTLKLDRDFIIEVQTYWTNFAKFGKPLNWHKFITFPNYWETINLNNSIIKIKDLNPEYSDKYFNNLFDKTCDGFWAQYY